VVEEADSREPIQDLAGELRGVPDVSSLEARNQPKASDQSAQVSPEIVVSV